MKRLLRVGGGGVAWPSGRKGGVTQTPGEKGAWPGLGLRRGGSPAKKRGHDLILWGERGCGPAPTQPCHGKGVAAWL